MIEGSNPALSRLIKEVIRERGPISFRDFMEMALYYPGLGYYNSHEERIGKKGDYYTAPHLTPIFGEMLGKQIIEMLELLGEGEFDIVEMGAGKGLLASDILNFIKKEDRGLFRRLRYGIIEISDSFRERQKSILRDYPITWYKSLEELSSGIKGVFISNELIDSFPVHIIIEDNGLKEIFVDWSDEKFVEVIKEPSTKSLKEYFIGLGVKLPHCYRTEVNLDALKWIERVSRVLEKGFVITIDYGYMSEEIYQPYRSEGTLLCYYKHSTCEDPYARVGNQDMTSHVNFSAIIHRGKEKGLDLTGFVNQARFLINIGIEDYLKTLVSESKDYSDYSKKILPIKNLLMPGMGETFKVLIQHKGIENPLLKCLIPQ